MPENLGQFLAGQRIENTTYELLAMKDEKCKVLKRMVYGKDDAEYTALHYACEEGHKEDDKKMVRTQGRLVPPRRRERSRSTFSRPPQRNAPCPPQRISLICLYRQEGGVQR